MKTDRYVSSVSNLFINNRLLKFVVIALALMQLMNYVSMREMQENQITILVPVGLSDRVEVGSGTADEMYLSAMAVYITQLLYSTTPSTVETQMKTLLKLFSPDAYKAISEEYLLSAVKQAKNQVTQTSKILSIKTQTEPARQIDVTIALERYIFGDKVDEEKQVKLRITYIIDGGRFIVTKLGEVTQ